MEYYDIPAAAKKIGFSVPYIRTLIRKGKLLTTMQPLYEGSRVKKHMIPETELKKFVELMPHKSRRKDGRNKYIVYVRTDEFLQMRQALLDAGLEEIAFLITPANKLKHWGDDET
jgi:hypothetical protein